MSERSIVSDKSGFDWRALTLQNDWQGSAAYRIQDDQVYLRGKLTSIGSGDDISAAFTVGATNRDYAPTFTNTDVNTSTNKITIANHLFVNTDVVKFSASATLPAPFVAGTGYFVVAATTNDFQLSLTSGGSAIDITTAGTGPFTLTRQGDNYLNATAHPFVNGEKLQLTTSNTLPGGLLTLTNYYVINKAADKFQVSLTLGGPSVDLSSAAGTGTHTATDLGLTTITTDGVVFATLPLGARPQQATTFVVVPADDDASNVAVPMRLEVQTDGDCALYSVGGGSTMPASISLAPVNFSI